MNISLEKAVLIAKKKLTSLNYDIAKRKIIADNLNSTWNKYISDGFLDLEKNPQIREMLEGKEFWAINFVSTEPVFGGVVFVFVDQKSGKVIGVLPFK